MCCTWHICWKLLHATPDVVRPFVLSKGYDGMPCPTPSDRVCCPRAMMAWHTRRRSTVCAAQRQWRHATADVVRPCVLQKGDDCMPCPTTSDRLCCPRAMMACHALRRPTVCAAQGRWWHSTLDVVRLCAQSKAIIACHTWHCLTVCTAQRRWWHETPNVIRPFVLS